MEQITWIPREIYASENSACKGPEVGAILALWRRQIALSELQEVGRVWMVLPCGPQERV